MEVERRRKYSGWNELTTEKENMLLKFLGFFRGPILYGMSLIDSTASSSIADTAPQSWKPPPLWRLVSGIGWMLASSLASSY